MYTEKNIKVILSSNSIREEFIVDYFPEFCKTIRNKIRYDNKNGKSLELITSVLNSRQDAGEKFYDFVVNKVTSPKGRFYDIENNYDHYRNLVLDLSKEISKSGQDNYSPDTFENQIVKPWFRKVLNEKKSIEDIVSSFYRDISQEALNTALSRCKKQLKNDLAEYDLFKKSNGKFLPAVSHGKNTKADGIVLNDSGDVEDLNIKTSRWPKFFYDGITAREAAILLYEKQKPEWFQSEDRTYIILPSDNGEKPNEDLSIEGQLNRNINDITFDYRQGNKKGIYNVSSVKVIFLD